MKEALEVVKSPLRSAVNVDDGSQSSGEIVFREIGLLLNILFPLSGRNFKPGSPNVKATMLECQSCKCLFNRHQHCYQNQLLKISSTKYAECYFVKVGDHSAVENGNKQINVRARSLFQFGECVDAQIVKMDSFIKRMRIKKNETELCYSEYYY